MTIARITTLKFLNSLALALTIGVNAAANMVQINGRWTQEISAAHPTLFTPAGFTFSIWSLIYLGLLGFILYQHGVLPIRKSMVHRDALVSYIGPAFVLSCLANITWLFAWHYESFVLTIFAIVTLLISLVHINVRVAILREETPKSVAYRWLVVAPFGLYLGWLAIATISNFSVYFSFIDWVPLELGESLWSAIMIIVGAGIGLFLLRRLKLLSAAAAIAWGILGLYVEFWQQYENFGLQAVCVLMIAFLITGILSVYYSRTTRRSFGRQSDL